MHPFLQAAAMAVQQAEMLGFLQVICAFLTRGNLSICGAINA